MSAYYNEIDKNAAAWLRELIAQGHIAPGDVDTRSIEDVRPDDLRGYAQCHFFAGIGVWSYALRRAGWADDRPIWTGSCPCQPFSSAGAGLGFADERHLWPAFHHLIKVRRPAVVIGEQVASKAVDAWIDLVHADLEALDYAFGSVPFPSAGVGAPHIRDRNYWVAHSTGIGRKQGGLHIVGGGKTPSGWAESVACDAGQDFRVVDADGVRCGTGQRDDSPPGYRPTAEPACFIGGMADNELQQRPDRQPEIRDVNAAAGWQQGTATAAGLRGDLRPGPTNGLWRDADWLGCRDGKWRPVRPGTFPLAHGAASRVGRLRGYGNAINAEAAKAWIEAVMECAA